MHPRCESASGVHLLSLPNHQTTRKVVLKIHAAMSNASSSDSASNDPTPVELQELSAAIAALPPQYRDSITPCSTVSFSAALDVAEF